MTRFNVSDGWEEYREGNEYFDARYRYFRKKCPNRTEKSAKGDIEKFTNSWVYGREPRAWLRVSDFIVGKCLRHGLRFHRRFITRMTINHGGEPQV